MSRKKRPLFFGVIDKNKPSFVLSGEIEKKNPSHFEALLTGKHERNAFISYLK